MGAFNRKIMFTVLLIASIAISVSSQDYNCKPGETFKDMCNTCHCGNDGKTVACTKMACPNVGDPRFTCTPHEPFKNDCNTCVCSSDGKSAVCTEMACITSKSD